MSETWRVMTKTDMQQFTEMIEKPLQHQLDVQAALLAKAALALNERCEYHQTFPLVENPQRDATYPLSGWYHEISPDDGPEYVVANCRLTDAERALLAKIEELG